MYDEVLQDAFLESLWYEPGVFPMHFYGWQACRDRIPDYNHECSNSNMISSIAAFMFALSVAVPVYRHQMHQRRTKGSSQA